MVLSVGKSISRGELTEVVCVVVRGRVQKLAVAQETRQNERMGEVWSWWARSIACRLLYRIHIRSPCSCKLYNRMICSSLEPVNFVQVKLHRSSTHGTTNRQHRHFSFDFPRFAASSANRTCAPNLKPSTSHLRLDRVSYLLSVSLLSRSLLPICVPPESALVVSTENSVSLLETPGLALGRPPSSGLRYHNLLAVSCADSEIAAGGASLEKVLGRSTWVAGCLIMDGSEVELSKRTVLRPGEPAVGDMESGAEPEPEESR